MKRNNDSNWFENNPKKTIFIIVIAFIIICMFASEKFFAWRNQKASINPIYYLRYITLRESPPGLADYFTPSEEDRKESDTLEIKKYRVQVDQNGFTMPSEKYAHPDLVLVFLGGSVVECMFVDEDKRFPYLTGCLLEKQCNIKINSYNGGVGGNNSLHSINNLINKVLPIKPNIVVMMHNINDISILLYEKSYWNNNPYRRTIVTEDHSLVNMVRIFVKKFIPNLYRELLQVVNIRKLLKTAEYGDEFEAIRNKQVTYDKTKLFQDFGENLQLFINICQIKHIAPVLMTMASRITTEPEDLILKAFRKTNQVNLSYTEFKGLFDGFNDTIRRKAHENNIALIDLARDIPPTREYMFDMVHLNAKGSEKVAAIIAEHLKPLIAKCKNNPIQH